MLKRMTGWLAVITLAILCGQAFCAGPMGHFVMATNTIQNINNGTYSVPTELRQALQHPDARKAFAGGSIGPDIYEGKTHYGNTGDLARKMLADARARMQAAAKAKDQSAFAGARKELAFAYGWLSHMASDLNVHPKVNGAAGDTYRNNNSGEKTIHAAQEAQLTAILRDKYGKDAKYDISVPYDFLSKHLGVPVSTLKAGVMKLNGKVMAELAAGNQVTITDEMRKAWGPVIDGYDSDMGSFLSNPSNIGNWDLDSGKLTDKEYDELRKQAMNANGGKLPDGWGKNYLDYWNKVKNLSAKDREAKLKEMFGKGGAAGLWAGSWSTNWGAMNLSVSGGKVTGNYTWDAGKIDGSISGDGRVLTGWWSESPSYKAPNDAGKIEFTLSADGKSFSGRWGYGDNLSSGGWTGSR